MADSVSLDPLTGDDLQKPAECRCETCKLDFSPRLWQSMQRQRLPYVFKCETCLKPILSPDEWVYDPGKFAQGEQYEQVHCGCRCLCDELGMDPSRPWLKVDPAWDTPLFKPFKPNCSACTLKPRIEKALQKVGFCQRDLYLEWHMREQKRLRQLERPPTRDVVEGRDLFDLEPEDRFYPPSSTPASAKAAMAWWGFYPNGVKVSTNTFSGLPVELEKSLLKDGPDAFGPPDARESMILEEREFHTPQYKKWHNHVTLNLWNSEITGKGPRVPEYHPPPLTLEDEVMQAKILEEREHWVQYFSQDSICKGLHRRRSLCSIDGDFDYRIARIQASTLPNGYDHGVQEHFDRHMYRLILRTLKEKSIKLFCPSNVWWIVKSMV